MKPSNNLSNYNLDDLADKIEQSGNLGAGLKEQSIIIAKAMIELKIAIRNLQLQVLETSKNIRSSIKYSGEQLSASVNKFSSNVEKYSASSDKYYKAIIWLTLGLVLVGIANVISQFINNHP